MTMLTDSFRDFRYAARGLARTPGFTVVAVAVLALGIGATSAIFSLVSAVWLKSPTFADAERIVALPLIGSRLAAKVMPDDEEVWLRRPSGDPAAVGRTIALTGSPHWVVRDVPRDFDFPQGG